MDNGFNIPGNICNYSNIMKFESFVFVWRVMRGSENFDSETLKRSFSTMERSEFILYDWL